MSIKDRLNRIEKSFAPAASQDCSLCGECLCLKKCSRCEHRRREFRIGTYDPSKGVPHSESKTCEACGRRRATKIVFNIFRTTGADYDSNDEG
jgi:hypothetical protein